MYSHDVPCGSESNNVSVLSNACDDTKTQIKK